MATRRRKSFGTRRPRRRFEWARYFPELYITSTQNARIVDLMDDFQTVLGADAAGTTVTRIRGELTFQYQYAPATPPVEPMLCMLGIRVDEEPPPGLTDDQQVALVNQHYADWMYYRGLEIWAGVPAEGDQLGQVGPLRLPIDIKSQRRFDELQQSLYLFLNAPLGEGQGELRVGGDLHVLLKMP